MLIPLAIAAAAVVTSLVAFVWLRRRPAARIAADSPPSRVQDLKLDGQLEELDDLLSELDQELEQVEASLVREERSRRDFPRLAAEHDELLASLADDGSAEEADLERMRRDVLELQTLLHETDADEERRAA